VADVEVRRPSGDGAGTVALDGAFFEVTPNVAVMHQVVVAQLAAARAGDHSTLTRAEVAGGGRKPWRQKGSGRARQGSIRAPHWRGGGVAMGPKPRSYRQRTPKKMVQLALRSALSDRAAQGRVAVVEAWDFDVPRTREAKAALTRLGLDGKVLVVLSQDDDVAAKSFRNLPDVQVILARELNAYDVLCNDWVVFTRATLPGQPGEPAHTGRPTTADEPAEASQPAEAGAPVEGGAPTAAGSNHDWELPLRGEGE
jgi:large subunit ribosomal protein L4